jgi:hypothetical protein
VTIVELIRLMQGMARDHRKRVFSLRELSALKGESRATTAMTLLRAARKGIVARAGIHWINLMDPPDVLEVALALRSPSYLSFESALHRRGIISQAPRGALTVAVTGRSGFFGTAVGPIRFLHLKPALFFGFDEQRVALAEKAWLDLLYIRGLRGRAGIVTEKVYLEALDRKLLARMARRFPAWVRELTGISPR